MMKVYTLALLFIGCIRKKNFAGEASNFSKKGEKTRLIQCKETTNQETYKMKT
jgi:hypothetical protein